ncbi:MAG: phosphatidylserine decarboxylase [Candidatus Cloacimonadia bacterium]
MILSKLRSPIYYKRIPPIYYIERESGKLCREIIPAEQWLKWLYYTPFGNIALESVIKRKSFSDFYGHYMNTSISAQKIKQFVEIFDIDLSQYEKITPKEYKSFNEFFTRKIRPELRPIDQDESTVISPADGKLLAYQNIEKDLHFVVKGYDFLLTEFLNNKELANQYLNGSLIIVRLAPADYHRYHFPFDTKPSASNFIKGKYYSVSPHSIKRKYKTFFQNRREYTILDSKHFKEVIMAEIGATLVGSIKQTFTPYLSVKKGDEKGYFEFGGSSVILLFKEGTISIDQDLINNTKLYYETTVKMGEKIATIQT